MVDKQMILDSVGPVQAVLDAHDGEVNVMDTTDGVIMISLREDARACATHDSHANLLFSNEAGGGK